MQPNCTKTVIIESFIPPETCQPKELFDGNAGTVKYCYDNKLLFVKCGNIDKFGCQYLPIDGLRIAPHKQQIILKNFADFIPKYGHFLTNADITLAQPIG